MNLEGKVTIAFYKGSSDQLLHRFIRYWTDSPYSHAELILPDGITWISISPFLTSRVTPRIRPEVENLYDWELIQLELNPRPAVRDYQLKQLYKFVQDTQNSKYDWVGMLLSQATPFLVKNKSKWYCSEWIAYALIYSRLLMWDEINIHSTPDISPGKLYNLLKNYKPSHYL